MNYNYSVEKKDRFILIKLLSLCVYYMSHLGFNFLKNGRISPVSFANTWTIYVSANIESHDSKLILSM